jgi:hypothetical protein
MNPLKFMEDLYFYKGYSMPEALRAWREFKKQKCYEVTNNPTRNTDWITRNNILNVGNIPNY